jgi:hypothetical protein
LLTTQKLHVLNKAPYHPSENLWQYSHPSWWMGLDSPELWG